MRDYLHGPSSQVNGALSFASDEVGPKARRTPKRERRVQLGQVFGLLTAIEDLGGDRAMAYRWKCRCACGGETASSEYSLIYGNVRSCGCIGFENMYKRRLAAARERFVGKTWGWLTVTEILPPAGNDRNFRFVASCACGAPNFKIGNTASLLSGWVSTCCSPRFSMQSKNTLLLDVLRQIHEGATHYPRNYRAVKLLTERGALHKRTGAVTNHGRKCLATGKFSSLPVAAPRKDWTDEQRLAIVLSSYRGEVLHAEFAAKVGISITTLYRWRSKFRKSSLLGPSALR
ncbi:transposase [Methylibium petroleiphilum]|uniref:Uncharacterized protein n=1 Tax=Methylibium petroleiphilum (strain ATCC BAA-1232 / LMG 22953 / PM1) TaxID=420662 RepID=A2SN48_METPP|nr:transposase [Methylibium petroleiphilum]ABM96987.1 hypothetical protein Mpe_B0212 [Methylibium petroleiphilum PM1]